MNTQFGYNSSKLLSITYYLSLQRPANIGNGESNMWIKLLGTLNMSGCGHLKGFITDRNKRRVELRSAEFELINTI